MCVWGKLVAGVKGLKEPGGLRRSKGELGGGGPSYEVKRKKEKVASAWAGFNLEARKKKKGGKSAQSTIPGHRRCGKDNAQNIPKVRTQHFEGRDKRRHGRPDGGVGGNLEKYRIARPERGHEFGEACGKRGGNGRTSARHRLPPRKEGVSNTYIAGGGDIKDARKIKRASKEAKGWQ